MEHCLGVWRQLDALEPVFTPMVWQRTEAFQEKELPKKRSAGGCVPAGS